VDDVGEHTAVGVVDLDAYGATLLFGDVGEDPADA
jgi:hypothetical protein